MCCCSCSNVIMFMLDLKEVDCLFALKLLLLEQTSPWFMRRVSGLWLVLVEAACAVL